MDNLAVSLLIIMKIREFDSSQDDIFTLASVAESVRTCVSKVEPKV